MPLQEWVTTALALTALCTAVAAGAAMAVERSVHRSHLMQAEQDHRRLHRLSMRLAGCVVELERKLEAGLPRSEPGTVPDVVAGQLVYLFALRDECELFTTRVNSHAARLTWPHGHLQRRTLTARRCLAAHDAVARAASALRDAARVYEVGFIAAYEKRAGRPGHRAPAEPLLLLSSKRARDIVSAREVFDEQMRLVATHTGNRHPFLEHYRCTWPALRSELGRFEDDPYFGEIQPLSRQGSGSTPVLHPDAR